MRSQAAHYLPIVSIAALLVAVGFSIAGPLNPPGGPVTSTYKTLAEVEPRIAISAANTPGDATNIYRITQPGSYYLTDNIAGGVSRSGIAILSSNVSIDLMGFTVQGVPGSFSGITTTNTELNNLSVRHGNITGWGGDGLDLANAGGAGRGGMVEGVHASNNGGVGIRPNSNSIITNCTAHSNASDGIAAFSNCTISQCVASYNAGDGIQVDSFCLVSGNSCYSNGYLTGDGAGILALGSRNRIENNQCLSADRGIQTINTNGYNIITRNTCGSNTLNWSLATRTLFTTIIDRTFSPTAGVSGNTASSTINITEPDSNISY